MNLLNGENIHLEQSLTRRDNRHRRGAWQNGQPSQPTNYPQVNFRISADPRHPGPDGHVATDPGKKYKAAECTSDLTKSILCPGISILAKPYNGATVIRESPARFYHPVAHVAAAGRPLDDPKLQHFMNSEL